MDTTVKDVAFVNTLYYLAYTRFPVTALYGEDVVMFNHRTGRVLKVSADGHVQLEPEGVYTLELKTDLLVMNASVFDWSLQEFETSHVKHGYFPKLRKFSADVKLVNQRLNKVKRMEEIGYTCSKKHVNHISFGRN